MSYEKKCIVVGISVFVGIVMMAPGAYAQPASDAWNQAITKFKSEQSALARSAGSEFTQQQKFVKAAVEVFIERARQVKQLTSEQTDIFPPEEAWGLLEKIDGNIAILEAYQNAISETQDIGQLRSLVGQITAHRATVGNDIRRGILTFYVEYFQKTTQKKVAARYEAIQEYIRSLQTAGKETIGIEKIFTPATRLMDKIIITMSGLLSQLKTADQSISLDDVESALQTTQKNIAAMYDIFRKITFQENTVPEVNKEEQGIQETFPDANL